ncbi:MAG: flippase-like domain-containing protein [Candidatus Tectomicrobia bacterium]|uniref:Flippase-like domain-containing protein n=1 Tax=Tectimicrobiota bacterium TaxID=2528274 RepID=A0A938B4C2_UNCTE|nr:flippase-like domain-containing protein [Candidatus Tectomicrobia bacterium]
MRISQLIVAVFFFAGLLLLGSMVWQVGLAALLTVFQAIGLWLVPWIALEIVPVLLHTAGWAACFQRRHGPVPFWRLFYVRLAGSAINQVTPTATLGGEVVKVLLLESSLPREQVAAAVVIDKASFTLGQILHLTLGTLYLTGRLPLPAEVQLGLGITIGLITLGLFGFVALQRYGLLSKLLRWLSGFRLAPASLPRLIEHLAPFEAHMTAYYTAHSWRFGVSLGFHVLAFACISVQNYLALYLLLGANAPALSDVIMLTITVVALEQMFFFVPGGLGTSEGIRLTILSTLGIAQVYGLAFGLMARLASLTWNALGLLAYAWYPRFAEGLRSVQPSSGVSTPKL